MTKLLSFSVLLLAFVAIQANAQTVYAAPKGTNYHTADCSLSGDAVGLSLDAAKKANKTPCAVCKPNEHFKDKTVQCSGKTADGTRCKRMTSSKNGKCFQHKSS